MLSLAGNILAAFALAGIALPRRARSRTLGRIIMSEGVVARGSAGELFLSHEIGRLSEIPGDLGHVSLTGNTLFFVL